MNIEVWRYRSQLQDINTVEELRKRYSEVLQHKIEFLQETLQTLQTCSESEVIDIAESHEFCSVHKL